MNFVVFGSTDEKMSREEEENVPSIDLRASPQVKTIGFRPLGTVETSYYRVVLGWHVQTRFVFQSPYVIVMMMTRGNEKLGPGRFLFPITFRPLLSAARARSLARPSVCVRSPLSITCPSSHQKQ